VRQVDLGWRNSSPQAALAFFPPEPVEETDAAALFRLFHGWTRGTDIARRIFVVRAPYNVRIRLVRAPGQAARLQRVPESGSISENAFRGLVTPILPHAQRQADVPACQIALNLFFVSDEPCSIQLMPPVFWPGFRQWPGSLVCGRFPLLAWPRPLNAVLEWQDGDRDWVLRRGDPLACVMPLYDDPEVVPRLFEARLTAALRRQIAMVDDVASVARNVGPMFAEAERRRPRRLLEPKVTAVSRGLTDRADGRGPTDGG
jgi:hypothetical protein